MFGTGEWDASQRALECGQCGGLVPKALGSQEDPEDDGDGEGWSGHSQRLGGCPQAAG